MNSELVHLLLRVLGTTMVIMAVIMLAKKIDEHRPTKDEVPKPDPDEPQVKGPYDASSEPEYDLNYKIYNKDIYGVDFKHGKKKQ